MLSHHAIARLFQDDDPETVRLVKEQLAEGGEEIVDDLKNLVLQRNHLVSKHATEVLNEISERNARDEFTLLCHFFNNGNSLELACWALSRWAAPDIDTGPYEAQIGAWGRQFLLQNSGHPISNRQRVIKLTEFIHKELGFQGNTEDYYNEKNALLPHIMNARRGMPVALTLIYMFIAERAGIRVHGINLPGHFIARHGEVLFDPFNQGKIVSEEHCAEILRWQRLEPTNYRLRPATPRQILLRILVNLLYIYELTGNERKHTQLNTWIRVLTSRW